MQIALPQSCDLGRLGERSLHHKYILSSVSGAQGFPVEPPVLLLVSGFLNASCCILHSTTRGRQALELDVEQVEYQVNVLLILNI